jgi:hypothetical protein
MTIRVIKKNAVAIQRWFNKNQEQVEFWYDYYTGDDDTVLDPPLPEGWELVGCGCSRIAFRGPDGLIYKLIVCGARTNYQQTDEWSNYQILARHTMPDGFRIPWMEQVKVLGGYQVNVVEEIVDDDDVSKEDKESDGFWGEMTDSAMHEFANSGSDIAHVLRRLYFDWHWDNYRVSCGMVVPIDLA